ncbi:MAG: STAS domain-containing protein [candidate division FCPU426 bacterium]
MTESDPKPIPLPKFSPELKQGMLDYWKVSQDHMEEVNQATLKIAEEIPEFAPIVKAMSPELIAKQNRESLERNRRAFVDGDWQPMLTDLKVQGEHYATMGISFSAWIELIRKYKEFMRPLVVRGMKEGPERTIAALAGMHEILYISIEVIGEAYITSKERIIRSQEEAIRELSTPVLKIREGLLILPLIGILDSQRARRVIESMLFAIRDHRAKAVVMDITGVPMVDSKVANHLVQSVEAARLMGSTVIITGLSPEIAQTMVALGAQLPNVKTYGDLQGGLEEAQAILDLSRKNRSMEA